MPLSKEQFQKLRASGLSVEKIAAAESRRAQETASPEQIGMRTAAAARQQAGSRLGRLLPAAGGLAGGLIGGVPGMTIGGMAGKAAQLGLEGNLPTNAPEAVREIGGAGVEQAVPGVLGAGIAKYVAPAVAKPLMGAALGVSRALREKFPGTDIVDAVLKSRIPITRGKGAEAAGRQLRSAANASKMMRLGAEWKGLRLSPQRILGRTDAFLDDVSKLEMKSGQLPLKLNPNEQSTVYRVLREFEGKAHGRMTPEYVASLKRHYQGLASNILKARAPGQLTNLRARSYRVIADRLKQALDTGIPGHAAREKAVQQGMAVKEAIHRAETESAVPNILTSLGRYTLLSPQLLSRGALLAQNPRSSSETLRLLDALRAYAEPEATAR